MNIIIEVVSVSLLMVVVASSTNPSNLQYSECYIRCTPTCFEETSCDRFCEKFYNNTADICALKDKSDQADCLRSCNGLSRTPSVPKIPLSVAVHYDSEYRVIATWSAPSAEPYLYYLEVRGNFEQSRVKPTFSRTTDVNFTIYSVSNNGICDEVGVRVFSVTVDGISDAASALLPKPTPDTSISLLRVSLLFNVESDEVELLVALTHTEKWPFGKEDLAVQPITRIAMCFSGKDVPLQQPTITMKEWGFLASFHKDYMINGCVVEYDIERVSSRSCGTEIDIFKLLGVFRNEVEISCEEVGSSNCTTKIASNCLCEQFSNFTARGYGKANGKVDETLIFTYDRGEKFFEDMREDCVLAYYQQVPERQETRNGSTHGDEIPFAIQCGELTRETSNEWATGEVTLPDLEPPKLYQIVLCIGPKMQNIIYPNPWLIAKKLSQSTHFVRATADIHFLAEKPSSHKKRSARMLIGITIGVGAAICIAITALCKWRRHQTMKRKRKAIARDCSERGYFEIDRRSVSIYQEKLLGVGEFGCVFQGRLHVPTTPHSRPYAHNKTPAPRKYEVAVKVLNAKADDKTKRNLLHEVDVMKLIGPHDGLVNLLACITLSEPLCIVLEYCNDGDLRTFLTKRRTYMLQVDSEEGETLGDGSGIDWNMLLTVKKLLMFAHQITNGLEYISNRGYAHCDVAARNILVHEGSIMKVGDFGMCRRIDAAASATAAVYSTRLPVKWMSPEAIAHAQYSTASDIWSFGVLLFEIITLGGKPYPLVRPQQMLSHLIAGKRIAKPENCSNDLYNLMLMCWREAPQTRPTFDYIREEIARQINGVTQQNYLRIDINRDYYCQSGTTY